jgi:ABC-2 type transport system ATP-binding protein
MQQAVITARGLGKRYGEARVLQDVDLDIPAGTVFGILGHNGAGKTTLVDILCTRGLPTEGSATVCGFDVVQRPHEVRQRIGVTGQFTAVDELVSGRANLVLIARLLGASPRQAVARADEQLEAFDLVDAADRPASTYSGGMKRRLDLAMSLVGAPDVVFLDEPTTGLDPISRSGVWLIIERLVKDGATVILTTQYLEEADRLADRIMVLAMGKSVIVGTPTQLKDRLGQRTATVTFEDQFAMVAGASVMSKLQMKPLPSLTPFGVTAVISAPGDIAMMVRLLDDAGVKIADMTLKEPSLDDVYLSLHHSLWAAAGSESLAGL